MRYWVLDASVWVARLVPQDIFFPTVKAWIEMQRAEGAFFLSPSLLLAEAAGAIARRTGDATLARRAVESILHIPELRLIDMDQALIHSAAALAADLGLRGADSIYAAAAVQLMVPLVTLDKDQNERASQVVPVHMISGAV